MVGIGAIFFGQGVTRRLVAGAVLSIAGVLVVLSRGEWEVLRSVRLVPGDVYVLLATAAWRSTAGYRSAPAIRPRSAATGPHS